MKVLHLLESSRFSGAENVVCQIIGIMKSCPEYEMVYCSRDGQIRQALEERGISFAPMKELSVGEVRRVLREQKPDVIHAHDMRAGFVAACACGRTGLVSHIHNNAFDSRKASAKSFAYAFAAHKARRVIWVSQTAYDGYAFHKLFAEKSVILRNIIDVDGLYRKMEKDTNSYGYDIVYIGRLTYQKDPQRLLRVCRQIADILPDVKIAIVGSGDLEAAVRALHEELRLKNNVFLLGFQSNPLKLLRDAKAMVMTSRWEGLPMCALEAMALGVPIVSTAVDGLREIIDSGENGYLCEEDAQIVEHLVRIVTDEAYQKKLSENALKKGREINRKERYQNTLLNVYDAAAQR